MNNPLYMNRAEKKYSVAIKWLDSLNQNKIVPGLERITKLMNILGNPQKKMKLIIIGGTNAKGSTCFNLNHNLTKNGFRIGCFTSPHIHSVRERIRIGEEIICIEKFTNILYLLKDIINENKLYGFESFNNFIHVTDIEIFSKLSKN